MKYFRLDLLTLLISLFIFSSCEKNGTIGLDIEPQDSINTLFTDTITVNTATVREDDVITSNIRQNPLGFINDPVFGTTEANLALGFSVPASGSFTFGTDPVLDSAVLVLKYGNEFYGDSLNTTYNISVHQLHSSTPYGPKTYYNNSSWQFEPASVGSLANVRRFAWTDSTTIDSIIKGAADKQVKVAPQLRIRLSESFINANFINADAARFKNTTSFLNAFRGLYVAVNKNQLGGGTGGIIFLNLQSSVSALKIYYKNQSGTATDTNVVSFTAMGASQVNRNYTGTPVEAALNSTNPNQSTVYVQPMAGVRTKLKFPYIKRLKGQGNISVNKAELVVPVVTGTDNPLRPTARLNLYRFDIAGQRQPVPDNAFGLDNRFLDERTFGGFYNATDKNYVFNITSYINDLIKGGAQYDTFIAPIDLPLTSRINISPTAATAARAVLGGRNHPQSPIKLRIIYSKPK